MHPCLHQNATRRFECGNTADTHQGGFSRVFKKLVFLLIHAYIGIAVAIPGCTLIFIESMTSSREDEVALLFSSRAVGSLAGWLLGLLVQDMNSAFNPINLVGIGISGLVVVYFFLPWMSHIWWSMFAFVFQGAFMILTTQGCLAYASNSHVRHRPHWSQQMMYACVFGCTMAPFVALPFLRESAPIPNSHSLSFYTPKMGSSLSNLSSPTLASQLHRVPRSINALDPPASNTRQKSTNMFSSQAFTPSLRTTTSSLETTTLQSSHQTTIHPTTNLTIPTSIVHTESTVAPMKPSVNDAMHLSQDSSSADGSQTASKMKQLSEERRIDTLAGVPPILPAGTNDNPTIASSPLTMAPSAQTNGTTTSSWVELMGSNITDSSPLNTSNSSGLFNDTQLDGMERKSRANASITFVSVSPSTTVLPTTVKIEDLRINQSYSTTFTPIFRQVTPISVVTTRSSVATTTATATTTLATATESTSPRTLANVATSSSTSISVAHISSASADIATTSTTAVEKSTSAPTTSQSIFRKHIAEHQTTEKQIHQLYSPHPLSPVQKLYLFLCLLGCILWLIASPLSTWCCVQYTSRPSSVRLSEDKVRLRCRRSMLSQSQNNVPTESASLLSSTNRASSEEEYSDEVAADESHYVSAQEDNISTLSNPECATSDQSSRPRTSSSHQVVDRDYTPNRPPTYLPEGPQWPKIYWPSDAWLLLAEFFNVGLETTYGAFIHGFAVRYLFWSPALAFLLVGLFWLGGLVGRLPGTFVLESDTSSRMALRPSFSHAVPSQPILTYRYSLTSGYTRWLFSAVRLTGSILCVVSAVVLTRLAVKTDRYTFKAITTGTNLSSGLPDHFLWLLATLTLGMGVGLSCSAIGSAISAQPTVDVHRLQLAGLLSQLLIPPLVAYVHHIAVFWRYTCVLSSAALLLGVVMCFALVADLLQTAVRRDRSHPMKDIALSTARSTFENPIRYSSPVTLHATDE